MRLRAETKAGDDDLVFTADDGRSRVDASNLAKRVLKAATVEAGLGEWVRDEDGELRASSWVGFHAFRHTCATILFRRGWNAVQVQRWLGHHKPSFTLDTYMHLLDEDVPEPSFYDAIAPSCDQIVIRTGLNGPKAAAAGEAENPLFPGRTPARPNRAEGPGSNS